MEQDLKKIITIGKRLHFIGIGGIGMSAIARVMLSLGYKVSGSDQKESVNTIRLKEEGAKIYIGHDAKNVRDAQIIVHTSAVKPDNVEMQEAISLSMPILERAKVLSFLMYLYKNSIAVAGTHGKTTTSSMMAVMLAHAGLDPTYLIGGEVSNLNSNGGCGKSSYFVAEADESDSSIKYLDPRVFVLTNIEKDHLDHFNGLDDILGLFERCVQQLVKHKEHVLVINGEQWGNEILLKRIKQIPGLTMITFGLKEGNEYRVANIRYKGHGSAFTVIRQEAVIGEIELSVPGEHNVLNALAVIAVGQYLGLDFLKIKTALQTFTGAKRRFTFIGQYKGIKVYDDYAHHPTEIRATLEAARKVFPKARLVCAFQPHRYSRTMSFMDEFAQSLSLADRIIVTGIYSAGEKPMPGISAETIVKNIPDAKAVYVEKKEQVADYLENELKEGDVFFTVGAGDIYAVGKEILNRLRSRRHKIKENAEVARIA